MTIQDALFHQLSNVLFSIRSPQTKSIKMGGDLDQAATLKDWTPLLSHLLDACPNLEKLRVLFHLRKEARCGGLPLQRRPRVRGGALVGR